MDGLSKTAQMGAAALPKEHASNARACWPEWLLALGSTSIAVGVLWDISWHISIGRDTFWTPAHIAIYLGGVIGGCVGGWLAIQHTFLLGAEGRESSVGVFGARAPLGAWVSIWGAIAMITSAPFDNWWHNAYGLDVKIISPPHSVLGLGMVGISVGAMLLAAARQNREPNGPGGAIFLYAGAMFVTLGAIFLTEFSHPNRQHAGTFYRWCAGMLVVRMVTTGRGSRMSWPITRASLIYMGIMCLMIWILPLFPAQPKLAPIFNPVTHMVPPSFPILLVFPALAMDLILRAVGENDRGWRRVVIAMLIGAVFVLALLAVQWFFAEFLLSPKADNWFFAGNRFWGYGSGPGSSRNEFWQLNPNDYDYEPVNAVALGRAWLWAAGMAWLALLWGRWMKKVKR